jgi:hypothetical protein
MLGGIIIVIATIAFVPPVETPGPNPAEPDVLVWVLSVELLHRQIKKQWTLISAISP